MYMGPSAAVSKLQLLQRILNSGSRFKGPASVRVFLHSDSDGKRVSIGDVSRVIKEPANPELVPHGYLSHNLSQWELRHLRWLMQKDNMGQDVFLIGGPGPLRRRIALAYLELTRQEAEYVTLTRDTTEADLKQRREIRDATSYYHDQAAVRAATEGRVLVLDGIEKAERNVLPVLNNLLENREMNLDDGRRLIPHQRYDALMQEHGAQVDALNVLRVSASFRVFALGLPCPPHQGQPLDPPLRSRFQAREISHPPFQDELQKLQAQYPGVSRDTITRCLSVGHALLAQESKALALPDYPLHLLHTVIALLNKFPSVMPESVLPLAYPHTTCLPSEAQEPLTDLLKTFDLSLPQQDASSLIVDAVQSVSAEQTVSSEQSLQLRMTVNGEAASAQVMGGGLEPLPPGEGDPSSPFIPNPHHSSVLSSLLQLHAVGSDVCVVGPRGCGKSSIVSRMASLLGYRVEPVLLYQDMTARDLMQQRATDDSGNTVWRLSPLLQAALQGSMAVLDGLHRLHSNTLAALHRLVQDREVQLYDGNRLLHHAKHDAIQSELGITPAEMTSRGLLRISPAFRIVALAEPPQLSDVQGQWMRPEALALMPWKEMRQPTQAEMMDLVVKLVQPKDSTTLEQVQQLCSLSAALSSSSGNIASLGQSLSLRQVLRIARRLNEYPGHLSLYELVQDACLARFLPILVKQSLDETMEASGIHPRKQAPSSEVPPELRCRVEGDQVTIGSTTAPRYSPPSTSKVPKTLFFDIQQHVQVLESLLQDWQLGEHLLLIGNQGVGKNKLVDRFLELINRPREYLQLHRDSTVQSLTVQPCVKDGLLSHQDSPLVTAVREGSVLLLDEADKAPTHVTCVLKTLVESGEMLLSDGRRIVPATHPLARSPDAHNIIVSHPQFRMIVLANRPGFPFLGNDFFAVLGDLFSCHGIHNPLPASELDLLTSYGPDVPRPLLAKLVSGFGALRDLADSGKLQYPYSTREVVAVVRHLQHYPKDGVSLAVRNVFDFDSWSADARDTVVKTLHQHGLPIDASDSSTRLATKIPLGDPQYLGRWRVDHSDTRPVDVRTERISYRGPSYVLASKSDLPARAARANIFTELHSYYHLPLPDSALITDLMTSHRPASHQASNAPKTRMTDTMSFLENHNSTNQTQDDTKESGSKNSGVSATVEALKDPFGTSKFQAAIHVATVAPLALHTLMPSDSLTRPLLSLSLHSVLPNLGGSHQPRLRLWRGVEGMVGLYEELTNTVLLADPQNGEVLQLNKNSFLERIKLPLRQLAQQHVANSCSASGDALFVYTRRHNTAVVVDPKKGSIDTLQLPVAVESVTSDGRGGWILQDDRASYWLIGGENGFESLTPFQLERDVGSEIKNMASVNDFVLNNALSLDTSVEDIIHGADNERPVQKDAGMLLSSNKAQAALLPGFPHNASGGLYAWFRQEDPKNKQRQKLTQFDSISHTRSVPPVSDTGRNCVVLPSSGQIVQTINELPPSAPDVLKSVPASGYLEVTDVADKVVSYLPVPRVEEYSEYWEWSVGRLAPKLMLAGDEHGGVVSVDKVGGVRVWQVGGHELKAGIAEWESMVGEGEAGRLELERSGGDMSLDAPKHGKLDSQNAPHVGGNTWAGGTGGRDTAGLGGVGGPYRLDAGHDVHQVSDEVKAAVPPEITEAARKMARAAHAKRLKEIQMSEYDHEQYEAVSSNVMAQVNQMRAVLSSLTAKAGERWWVRRRPDGELDDNALVDGLAGATNIYRQRREIPPEAGQPQTKPKRLRLLLDASGSMYRFNGLDQRLQRSLEAALMLMEACKGHESRLVYDVYAHSGEDNAVRLSHLKNPPDNNKKRLDLLRTVLAHSQFCMSGDSTVMATKYAVDQLAQTADDYDQSFVVLLSDANLDRYGISPARFAAAMTAQSTVQCYVVFIGSLGNQAKKLANALPAGRAYVCMDTHELPQILQHIFTHAMTQ